MQDKRYIKNGLLVDKEGYQSDTSSGLDFEKIHVGTSGYCTIQQFKQLKMEMAIQRKMLSQMVENFKYLENNQKTQISTTTEWVMEIEERLDQAMNSDLEREKALLRENVDILSEIGQWGDNWNNYGAKKFSQELIFKCLQIINAGNLNYQPDIFPTARESIQLEYEPDSEHYLEVEVFIDTIKVYKRIKNEKYKFPNLSTEELFELINEFQSQL